MLMTHQYSEISTNSKVIISFNSCTGIPESTSCKMKPDAGYILPPVTSSRLTTKQKFSFKYGRVEIKAKLPKGDWLYPGKNNY